MVEAWRYAPSALEQYGHMDRRAEHDRAHNTTECICSHAMLHHSSDNTLEVTGSDLEAGQALASPEVHNLVAVV